MISDYDAIVASVERNPGVLGAMLVGIDDGMLIAGGASGESWAVAAALASSLFRRTRQAAADAGLGEATFVRLEADRGHVCATAKDDFVLVAVSAQGINLGKLRLEMISAMEELC